MAKAHAPLYAFNAGTVSRKALGRIDLTKMRIAAEEQTNFLPQVLGPMVFRPGTEYLLPPRDGLPARMIPFVFSADDTALVELTENALRVYRTGAGLVTRSGTASTIANGDFSANLGSWSDDSDAGSSTSWSSFGGGSARLNGTGINYGAISQQVSNAGGDHSLAITILSGRVSLRIGTTEGGQDILTETVLRPGVHSIAFLTAAASFHVWLGSSQDYPSFVGSCNFEGAGTVVLATPWSDLSAVRFVQSGDVLFVCDGQGQPKRIERRNNDSWSVVDYAPNDGPFLLPNLSATSLQPSSRRGAITLTSSPGIFSEGHVGALFRLTHPGQRAEATLAGAGQETDYIRLSGLSRGILVIINPDGSWNGTVSLQRSVGEPLNWTAVETYTGAVDTMYDDDLDNQIIYYRLAIEAGDYTSGSVLAILRYDQGATSGVVRVREFTSRTQVTADVLSTLSSVESTRDWSEGAWSAARVYPSAVSFHDGRLFWAARDGLHGSVSDAYESFDDETEGDSGPIDRTIATGGVDRINWLVSLQRLLAGTAAQEVSIRASGFDEPLTPTQFTARVMSNRGSADIQAVGVDSYGVFVQRDNRRVFELVYGVDGNDYRSMDLTRLNPQACSADVVRITVQRTPDTRVWFVLEDGTAAVLTYERDDEVVAWTHVETSGQIEDVCVLPGDEEDDVYVVVNRSGGRYLERFASMRECEGGDLSKTSDAHVVHDGVETDMVSGLDHLEGETVVAWADGAPVIGEFTVEDGAVTLPFAVSKAVVGLPYEGRFKSTKLAYGAELGTAMTFPKRISRVALLMADVAWKGVKIGRDFAHMTGLGATYNGRPLDSWETLEEYSFDGSPFNGGWTSDSRMCIKVVSPFCATIMAAVVQMETNERDIQE